MTNIKIAEYTWQYTCMYTWILKDERVATLAATYIAPVESQCVALLLVPNSVNDYNAYE